MVANIARVSLADRYAVIERTALEPVRLNGEPARIVGAKNDYATVRSLTSALETTYSWEAARRLREFHAG